MEIYPVSLILKLMSSNTVIHTTFTSAIALKLVTLTDYSITKFGEYSLRFHMERKKANINHLVFHLNEICLSADNE